jgi:DNA-binding MarR family transcriptional regulator
MHGWPADRLKGNILNMSDPSQSEVVPSPPLAANPLDLGLDGLDPAQADRIRLFRLLEVSAMQLRARMDRLLAPQGLTTQQAALLQHIEGQDTPPTISRIAQAMAMSHQNLKQIALALERKGFLRIEVDAADRRARRLVLTERHHAFWRDRNPGDFDQVAAWTSVLRDAEVALVVGSLQRLLAGLRQSG